MLSFAYVLCFNSYTANNFDNRGILINIYNLENNRTIIEKLQRIFAKEILHTPS